MNPFHICNKIMYDSIINHEHVRAAFFWPAEIALDRQTIWLHISFTLHLYTLSIQR